MAKTALWLWLIPSLNILTSSIRSQPFPQLDLQGYRSNMCGNTMAYPRKSFQTVALNSYRNSPGNYTDSLELNWWIPQLTTLKVTDKHNGSTRNWSNTFESLSTNGKMTGTNYSPLRNSSTTTTSIPQPAKFCFF